jgi:hypothetical protein
MRHLDLFEGHTFLLQEKKAEKKAEKWLQKAIKKPGALHKALGVSKDESIPMDTINKKIEELDKKKKEEEGLTKKELKMLRRLNLAKTLKTRIG